MRVAFHRHVVLSVSRDRTRPCPKLFTYSALLAYPWGMLIIVGLVLTPTAKLLGMLLMI
jgi:hypothetical protein